MSSTTNESQTKHIKTVYLTLSKVAEITGIIIPECFDALKNEKIVDISQSEFSDKSDAKKGIRLFFAFDYNEEKLKYYVNLAKEGVVVITAVCLKDEHGEELPQILLPSYIDVRHVLYDIAGYIKKKIKIPTIGITGSVGKTTITSFLQLIFSEKNKVFVSGNNLNGPGYIAREIFRRYNDSYDYHIQEVGGGRIKGVEDSATILDVDAYCISNVLPHHIDNYKTLENVLYDKTSFDRISNKDIFGVINIDDNMLNSHHFNNRIVTCAIHNKNADYIAENILQSGSYLEMDIRHSGETIHVKVKIVGRHNAYNVLIAVAMAKEWGIHDIDIINGLSKYSGDMMRQSLAEVSGRLLYIDCFNVSAESIRTCLETLEQMPIESGCKKIAVLGGENALGSKKSFSINYELGLSLIKYDIDEYVIIGRKKDATESEKNWYGDSYALYKGIRRSIRNKPIMFFDDLEDAGEYLSKNSGKGDIILFKGIYRLCFWAAIDIAFATSLTIHNPYFKGKTIQDNVYTAEYYEQLGGGNILKCHKTGNTVLIPNTIGERPMFRIGKGVFANIRNLKEVDLSYSIKNIGAGAFENCVALQRISNSNSILHIEKEAFSGCCSINKIILNSCEHIEARAFKGCINLSYVQLSESCTTIEEEAFAGCDNLTIFAPRRSYAIEYAKLNNIKYNDNIV